MSPNVEKVKAFRACQRAYLQKLKDVPCADCGRTYPYYVMDFDHLGNKKFNLSSPSSTVSWKRLLEEVAKCEIICSNCHRIRSHSRLALKVRAPDC